jgi:hypothetical protein
VKLSSKVQKIIHFFFFKVAAELDLADIKKRALDCIVANFGSVAEQVQEVFTDPHMLNQVLLAVNTVPKEEPEA